ncbi:MAG: seg [Parcubacteria group bacterium]|nr:seg [Parcubacteria group bacterium]
MSPKKIAISAFFLLIILYSLFQGRFIILGPNIQIDSPQNGQRVETLVTIQGHADNISFISLNDRPIFIDKNGDFSEKWIAPKGVSIITMRARDRFGREKEKQVQVVNQ